MKHTEETRKDIFQEARELMYRGVATSNPTMYTDALCAIDDTVEQNPAGRPDITFLGMLTEAEIHMRFREPEAALRVYGRAVKKNPCNQEALLGLAAALTECKHYENANLVMVRVHDTMKRCTVTDIEEQSV